ncbi:apolipoprotein acyltransferase [Sulfitobacter sp. SK011]|uniref:apolipoprotein acyltransferase n=1 Tax=Sulfitobacter sp. SK011 TaxID=1389004 RepID=UPI000E0B9E9D|nr:apolipoprotein acyltransferase [Sulfitobacter sp. SK011]AXI42277.1 apolipoprotein acyltransferase [Sulfitobacter sp. SK011]
MIVIILGILGAFLGGRTAQKRGGNRKDIAQYAVGYAMAFVVVGMILTVILDRLLSGT